MTGKPILTKGAVAWKAKEDMEICDIEVGVPKA